MSRHAPPSRPEVVLQELEDDERAALESLAASLLGDADAWPYFRETCELPLAVACDRRIERLTRVEGISTTSALKRTATAFGLKVAAVRSAYYRRTERIRQARREFRAGEAAE